VDVTLIDGDSSPGSTDIYAINMSNLDTYTFNVYNGKDGVDGKDASELNIDAINVSFDNSSTDLISSNVQNVIEELNLNKANINDIISNLVLIPTSSESEISGYYRLVDSSTSPYYDTVELDYSTGILSGSNILLGSFTSEAGKIVGDLPIVNITTVGSIRKDVGNDNNYAEFFFRVYKRDSSGIETLLGESNTTGPVNPKLLGAYLQLNSSAIILEGTFEETDRFVVKYFANALGTMSVYSFRFGGISPVRTLIPLPLNVIPGEVADKILLKTENFNNILSKRENNVQKALEKLDSTLCSILGEVESSESVVDIIIDDGTRNTLKILVEASSSLEIISEEILIQNFNNSLRTLSLGKLQSGSNLFFTVSNTNGITLHTYNPNQETINIKYKLIFL
jgi:hypothetical protein